MKRILSIALVACVLLSGCAALPAARQEPESGAAKFWPDPGIEGNLTDEAPRLQDDFHAAVNYDWLKSARIPDGEARYTQFHKQDKENSDRLKAILSAPSADSADERLAAAIYASALDWDARDKAGLGALGEDFEAILAATDLASLTELLTSNPRVALLTPLVNLHVQADDKDSAANVCVVNSTSLTLGDAAEYRQMTAQGELVKAANDACMTSLLTHFGVSAADAAEMIADAFDFETKLAAGMFDLAASYDPNFVNIVYNPRSLAELGAASPSFPLKGILEVQGILYDGKYILYEPEWLEKLNELYTEDNVKGLRAYLATAFLDNVASYCDNACVSAVDKWNNDRYGTVGAKSDEDKAYDLCNNLVGELLGRVYVAHYFDEASKADVTDIIGDVLAQFNSRLQSADWLTEQTRATAIEKLETMTLHVGYPNAYRPWETLEYDGDAPLIDLYVKIAEFYNEINAAELGKPVNRDIWGMSAHEVNAFYNPSDNSINFPAGILQGVFYSKDASRSRNLGGIGVVIGHEITHAFDSTGSLYDKDGNLNDWWTEADRAAFDEKTSRVEAYFDSVEVVDGKSVHGNLTLGESVADLGGVSCSLDLMAKLDEPDYDAFFRAYAGVWAEKITKEMRINKLDTDPHPPCYLRTNISVQQFEEFYDAYGVNESDGMYVAPEERLAVW